MILLSVLLSAFAPAYPDQTTLIEHCFDMRVHDFCVIERITKEGVAFIVQRPDLGAFGELPIAMPGAGERYAWVYEQLSPEIKAVTSDEFGYFESEIAGGFRHDMRQQNLPGDNVLTSNNPLAVTVPFGFATGPTEEQQVLPTLRNEQLMECDGKCQHGVLGTMIDKGVQATGTGVAIGATIGALGGVTGSVSGAIIGGLIAAPLGILSGYEIGMGEYSTPDVKTEKNPAPGEAPAPPPGCDPSSTSCAMPNPEHVDHSRAVAIYLNLPQMLPAPPPSGSSADVLPALINRHPLGPDATRPAVNPVPSKNTQATPGPDTLPRPPRPMIVSAVKWFLGALSRW